MGVSYSHSPVDEYDVSSIMQSTGLSNETVHRLYRRYRHFCRHGQTKTLSRQQLLTDPTLSLNPLCNRIVCAMFRNSEQMDFAEFCSAMSVFRPSVDPASKQAKVQFIYRMLAIEGNDYLTVPELCSLLHMLVGKHLPQEQIQSIASRALSEKDKAKQNRITYEDFERAMEGLEIEDKMSVYF